MTEYQEAPPKPETNGAGEGGDERPPAPDPEAPQSEAPEPEAPQPEVPQPEAAQSEVPEAPQPESPVAPENGTTPEEPGAGDGEQPPVPDPEVGDDAGQESPAEPAGEQPPTPEPEDTKPVDRTSQDDTEPVDRIPQDHSPPAEEDGGTVAEESLPRIGDETGAEQAGDTTDEPAAREPAPDPDETSREPSEEAADQADRDEVTAPETSEDPRWDEVRDLLPTDRSGRQLTPGDCRFLDISPEQARDWSDRTAPLGMTPEQYDEFRTSLGDALRADGIDPAGVDARLQGSSARFFSGEHKSFPARDGAELSGNPEAQARYDVWIGDGTPFRQRPFDSMNKLGVEDEPPSDYDVQLSSDQMVERAEAYRQENLAQKQLFSAKYDFVRKDIMAEAFPNLR